MERSKFTENHKDSRKQVIKTSAEKTGDLLYL